MRPLLHVARVEDWRAAQAEGAYAVPAGRDRFTHACFPEQLDGVLERFHAGTPREALVLLEVDPEGLPVRVEAARDGAGDFPHVFGPIPLANVLATHAVP